MTSAVRPYRACAPSRTVTSRPRVPPQDLQERDERDSSRSAAPLKAADDAHVLDTSSMSAREVVEAAAGIIQAAFPWLSRQ